MSPNVMSIDAPMDLSTKTRRKLRLEEFLRQNLDQAPAAHVIQWVNREQGVFRILWTHQSSGAFTHQDAALFRYWALARGKPANLSSVELKQSLRMALNKSPSVERLAVANDEYRYFKFTDWKSQRKNNSGAKNVKGQQQETARKRSPPPRHPPPLVPISYKHSSSPPLSTSSDHISLRGREDKPATPFSEELLRKLLESTSRYSQFARESQHGEEVADKHLGHSHFLPEHTALAHIFPKHLIPKSQFTEENIQRFSLRCGDYNKDHLTLDYRTREEALHDPLNNNHLLMEHMKYFPKAHSPQDFSEPQHAVPSYKESLTRPDMDGAISLYSDNPFYPTYHHYDYRSTAPSASLYSIPDQALATPHDVFESRLINIQ